ncbi:MULTISPECIES: DUF6177 family protein [unclassified Nocardiopsis]|uniref:DUF6177 family protein n=1 Tax=unclassified Nocardiopsis TaxID=2649073 RepID=UPI00135C5BA1|nr:MULTISPECIES: DUF6177 family protein [unclassified Nocardiopsis]
MSYDAVALVAGEPALEAVARALGDVDPGLWLHGYEGTSLLRVCDAEERLLATLEPGRSVGSPGEVGRLLGAEVQAQLPAPCWWVEVRARPDRAGREVAHRIADGLVLRLGGLVWTSGGADFGLWEDTSHPAVERATPHAVLVAQDREVVPFSSWLGDVVATGGGRRRLQVLTPETSRLTYGLWTFVTGPLGLWVVRGADGGHYDGVTGLPLTWDDQQGFVLRPEEADGSGGTVTPPGEGVGIRAPEAAPGFLDAAPTGVQLALNLSVVHEDRDGLLLGRAAEVLAEYAAGPPPAGWGRHEPALIPWDRELLTRSVRHRAPRAALSYFSGPGDTGHPYSGQIRVTWSGDRVREEVSMLVGFGSQREARLRALPELVTALAGERLLDTLWARRFAGRGDTTHEPRWRGPGVPLGLAIGPERLSLVGRERAEAGPLRCTLLGEEGSPAAWYPVVADPEKPMRAVEAARAQWHYLASSARG